MLASVVVLTHGEEPWVVDAVDAILASTGIDVEVILVDNDGVQATVAAVEARGARVLRPGGNIGFAKGCNTGASAATGDVVVFINSDAIVESDTLAKLAAVAVQPDVGIATATVVLAEDPPRLNSQGNEVHFLGFGWSGRFGEPVDTTGEPRPVCAASGAAMAVRRELWERLGGFCEEYFIYHEDAEISIRCWQQGLRVVVVPDAVVVHHYEFTRHARKYYLLERNRLLFVLTLYERRTLLALAPLLLAAEVALLCLAVAEGMWRHKIAGWRWIASHRRWVRERRKLVQDERVRRDTEVFRRFSTRLTPGNVELPGVVRAGDHALAGYWWLVSRLL